MSRLIAFLILAAAAFGADPFYVGTYKIDSAVIGPWWDEKQKPDDAEMKGLIGKSMKITATSITGPRQVACRNPRFVVKDYPADMLFQGAFGEMREKNKSVDPSKEAAKVGFKGTSWKTLETGCGNELDYHFIDASTLTFGLNNYIYIVKKQPAAR